MRTTRAVEPACRRHHRTLNHIAAKLATTRHLAVATAAVVLIALPGCRQDAATPATTPVATATPTAPPMMRIMTPTPGAPLPPPATPGADGAGTTAPAGTDGRPATYVVQQGDTLYSIAIALNIDVNALADANNIANPDALQLGQVLTIPNKDAP